MTKFVRGDIVKVTRSPGASAVSAGNGDAAEDTAVVVSPSDLEHDSGLLWIAQVVTGPSETWSGDVPIVDTAVAGVAANSWARTALLATVPVQSARRIGRISGPLLARVLGRITAGLARL